MPAVALLAALSLLPPRPAGDTIPVSGPVASGAATRPAADTARPTLATAATVTVWVRDTLRADATFPAWEAELKTVAAARPAGGARGPAAVDAELRLVRSADATTRLLAARLAAGQRLAAVVVAWPGGPAGDSLRVRLLGATVASQRLALPAGADGLEAEGLGLAATQAQLESERGEAARRATELEALERRRLAAPFEVARARERVRELDARLAAAARQRELLAGRVARAGRPVEEVTLRAERVEMLDGGDGPPR